MIRRGLIRGVAAIVISAFTSLILSSCVAEPAHTTAVAFVVGNRSNSPEVTFENLSAAVSSAVDDVEERRTSRLSITLVQADGYPRVLPTLSHEEPASMGVATRERERRAFVEAASAQFSGTRADDNEAATLDAISRAADAVSGAEIRVIYVFDSGLSTAGLLSLAGGRFGLDPADVADRLSSEGLLPDLAGTQVVWSGLGEVKGEQHKLDAYATNTLESMWSYVLKAAGSEVTFVPGWAGNDPDPTLPDVTRIEPPLYEAPLAANCRTELGTSTLRFYPDSSEFIDKEKARLLAAEITASLGQCAGCPVVTGTTSSFGTEEGRAKYSTERADAFAQLLMAALPATNDCTVKTRGVGMEFDGYVNDRDGSGVLVENLAAENRLIIVEFS